MYEIKVCLSSLLKEFKGFFAILPYSGAFLTNVYFVMKIFILRAIIPSFFLKKKNRKRSNFLELKECCFCHK